MTDYRERVIPLGVLLSVAWWLTACGSATESESSLDAVDSPVAEAAVTEAMVRRGSIGMYSGTLSVGRLFPTDGQVPIADDVFRASVVDVRPGRAFDGSMDGDPANPQVPFDDASADWRSFHIQVEVLEVFAGDVAVGDELVLGLAFGPQTSASDVRDGFLSYGQVVAFTTDDEFVVPYDDSLVPVAWDGAFLSPVDEGRLPFPAFARGEYEGHGGEVLSKFDTLAEIRALSSAAAG